MRILVTAFAPVPGTSPHGAALMAMVATLRRAELDLVTLKTDQLSHIERVGDARMFRVPVGEGSPMAQREAFDRAVARQLEAERYDVIHVRGPFDGALVADRKAALGFRLVYEMATFPDESLGSNVEAIWSELHERCVRAADLILVPTEAARRAVGEAHPEAPIELLSPGVDVGALDWRAAEPHEVSRLLFLGNFTSDRDLPTVLAALRRVHEKRPIRALFAGDPDRSRREQLRRVVESFGLADRVEVRGEPSARSIPDLIGGADLCLAPAAAAPRFQTLGDLPEPLLEYMACQRPVIAGAVPGVAEVLRDEGEGLLYPPGDDEALADAILTLLGSPDLSQRITLNAYERVRRHYSSGSRRRRLARIYATLLPALRELDPWQDEFADDELGPSASVIEAADAALRAEGDATTAEGIEAPNDDGEPPIQRVTSDPEIADLAEEPTSAYVVVDEQFQAPRPHPDTDPGHGIGDEQTRPGI